MCDYVCDHVYVCVTVCSCVCDRMSVCVFVRGKSKKTCSFLGQNPEGSERGQKKVRKESEKD